ncbi:MAG: tetratricopeptide repeat protein [Candidatus Obscuribacterales bacterium]|nr:tetratricopeptide repeat protein [Candidatus Obscuribacterales bacterium]
MKSSNEPPGQGSTLNSTESKYSPNRTVWTSDPDYKGELMGNPSKQVPDQCVYVMPNPRTHLIDHFIDNTPPLHIPLTSWKYDFIAGELALDVLDFDEAKAMFTLAQSAANKESIEENKRESALCKMRLAYIARKSGDLLQADRLYKECLESLKSISTEDQKAQDVILQELALISWKEAKLSDAETYLRQRVALIESQSGPIGPALATAQNDLANTLYYQNKLEEAGKLYKQCLLVAQRFTDNSNHTLQAASNMANCRLLEHKYADALELYGLLHNSNKVNGYIQQCQEALSKMPAAASKASDLPPPIGDPTVAQLLIKAAKINISHDKNWDAKALLKAAKKEAEAAGSASLKTEINIVEADIEFAGGNYGQAAVLYQQALADSAKSKVEVTDAAASAQAKLMLSQIALKDEASAQTTFAELQKNKSKSIWKEVANDVQEMYVKHRLYFDNKSLSSLLVSICKACVEKTDNNSMYKALALANLGRAYQQAKNMTEAEEELAQAREIANKAKDKNLDQTMSINKDLAILYMQNKEFKTAETILLEMMSYREKNPGQNNRNLIESLQLLSSLYSNWQRPDKEEFYYKRAQSLRPATTASFRARENVADLTNLAAIAIKQCDFTKASSLLQEALKQQQQTDNRGNDTVNRELVSIYQRSGQYEKLQNLEQKLAQASQSPADRTTMQTLYAASQAAFKCGNYDAAAKLTQQIITTMEQNGENKDKFYGCYYDEPRYTSCLFLLANCILDGEHNHDKAIVILDKCINAGTGGPSSPGIAPRGRGPALISGPPPLSEEQLIDLLICTDAIGNKNRADDYRKQLKDKIEQFHSRNSAKDQTNLAYEKVLILIEKTKRTSEEDLQLMELFPQAMHTEGSYSGQADSGNSLERAIVLREHSSSKESQAKANEDYAKLMQIYLDARNFEAAEPLAVRRLDFLKKQSASVKEISTAKIDYAEVLKERGYFPVARDMYKAQLEHLSFFSETTQYKIYNNLAAICEILQDYDEELRYLGSALKLLPISSAEWRQTTAHIATIYDIMGKHSEASALYKKALDGTSEAYQVVEPLRQAADRAAQNKQYALGDYLYRRIIELQSLAGSQSLGTANAFMQMARMYRWGDMQGKSRAAYEEAIAYCKSHKAEESSISTAEQELSQLLQKK